MSGQRVRRWTRWVVGAAVLMVVALGTVGVPIKASSRHWAITAWVLDFIKRRSVATQALGVEAPPPATPESIRLGAAHFEGTCQPCHGRPGETLPIVPHGMTPHPPSLPPQISRWSDKELFSIVRHGIKFTGMPAWPAQNRPDEVWAVVGFLRRLPDLDNTTYRRLVQGGTHPQIPAAATPLARLVMTCARCHGEDGMGRGTAPRLAGQQASYLRAALKAYAEGTRPSGFMTPVAAGLDNASAEGLSRLYAVMGGAMPRTSAPRDETAGDTPGERIALRGIPARLIPPCAVCHGPHGSLPNPEYPALAGQRLEYLVRQLEVFQRGQRGGTPHHPIMQPIAQRLTADDIRAVARYYADPDRDRRRPVP